MSSENPFASPNTESQGVQPPPVVWSTTGEPLRAAFQDGFTLVMHRRAPLPDRCVKSNLPAEGNTLQRKLSWHPPSIVWTVLLGVIVYAVLAIVLTKRATISVGLSPQWKTIRTRRIITAWIVSLLGVAMFCGSFAKVAVDKTVNPELLILGIVTTIIGLAFGAIGARMVRPIRITDTHVWLRGVHPDYLADLPAWPGK